MKRNVLGIDFGGNVLTKKGIFVFDMRDFFVQRTNLLAKFGDLFANGGEKMHFDQILKKYYQRREQLFAGVLTIAAEILLSISVVLK